MYASATNPTKRRAASRQTTGYHVGAGLGIAEGELLARLETLLKEGVLTRFGPQFDAERLGGALSLCAMSVPARDFERVAALVNAHREVAHNYEREHRFNMWFVLASDDAAAIARVVARIEAQTGYRVTEFPREEEYFVELRLTA